MFITQLTQKKFAAKEEVSGKHGKANAMSGTLNGRNHTQ